MAWAPDYCTLPELKNRLRIEDSEDDAVLAGNITSASRAIDDATDRQFGLVAAPEERRYRVTWSRRRDLWMADVDDLMTETGLEIEVEGAAITSADYELFRENAPQKGQAWTKLGTATATVPTRGPNYVTVTARWGWTTVPTTIKEATLLQASRYFKRRDSPFGVAGSPDTGSELRLLAKVDADVEVMVHAYNRSLLLV